MTSWHSLRSGEAVERAAVRLWEKALKNELVHSCQLSRVWKEVLKLAAQALLLRTLEAQERFSEASCRAPQVTTTQRTVAFVPDVSRLSNSAQTVMEDSIAGAQLNPDHFQSSPCGRVFPEASSQPSGVAVCCLGDDW